MRFKWQDELERFRALPEDAQLQIAKEVSVTTTQDFSHIFTKATGPYVFTAKGERFLDFSSCVGSMNFGHGHEAVLMARAEQFKRLDDFHDQDWPTDIATLFKMKLASVAPGKFRKKVFLAQSGTEWIEAAIKLSRAMRPDRDLFIHFDGSFHGRTLGALSLHGSNPIHREHFPKAIKTISLPFPDENITDYGRKFIEKLAEACPNTDKGFEEVNALFIELVQGEGGINVSHDGLIKQLVIFCENNGILLVVDETQTCCWRTGKFSACEHYGIEPDIIGFGKSMGYNLPVSAMVCRADPLEGVDIHKALSVGLDFKPKQHSNTWGGYVEGCVNGLCAFEMGESLDPKEIEERVKILREFAPEGLGLMRRWRFETPELRDQYVEEAKRRGILLLGAGVKNVRFMPQVNILTDILEGAIETLQSIPIPHLG